ncbi:MAG: hypothetical protein KKA73_00605 [Chloroflexi bacterium]|nr:hypothetical protein [Chloroflexota bacterium]MBU1746162.1 hypothetical protein [Chloroflexota bacterium]
MMILEERGLTPTQMQSVIGISVSLIQQYRDLYAQLNEPEYRRTLERLQRTVWQLPPASEPAATTPLVEPVTAGEKGGRR